MTPEQQMVREFHEKYGHFYQKVPRLAPLNVADLRYELIREELAELLESLQADDLVGIADDLGDLLYVVLGAACAFGIDLEPIFLEIHASNMSKQVGLVREDGKQLKGPEWRAPALGPILDAQSVAERADAD